MWRALRRTHLTARQRQAQGLTLDGLEQLLGSLTASEPRDVRDAALLSLAYETLCRRGELVALNVEDLTREADGSGRLLLRRSKTDQEGAGAVVYVSPETMTLIDRWLALAAHPQGALFRSIPHIGKPPTLPNHGGGRYPRALTDGDIARIFKRRARAAGLKDATRVSGHSTRVGAAQDLLAENFSVAAVMQQGRWKSERMVVRYGERLAAGQSAMAQLLKRRRGNEPEV
jgi:integrase